MDKPLTDAELEAMRAQLDEPISFTAAEDFLANTAPRLIAELTAWRKAGRQIVEWQREKCETAPQEILFAMLDIKIGIALALLPPKAEEPKP